MRSKDYLNDLLALSDSGGLSPRSALLDCCAAFGSSEHDVNTSLTASGMLWTIADRDATAFSLHHVMSKLAVLATDKRQEVRQILHLLKIIFLIQLIWSTLISPGEKLLCEHVVFLYCWTWPKL